MSFTDGPWYLSGVPAGREVSGCRHDSALWNERTDEWVCEKCGVRWAVRLGKDGRPSHREGAQRPPSEAKGIVVPKPPMPDRWGGSRALDGDSVDRIVEFFGGQEIIKSLFRDRDSLAPRQYRTGRKIA